MAKKVGKKQIKNYLNKQEITITKGELEKVKQEAVMQAIDTLIPFQLMVLHDKEGWGKKRLKRFHDQFMELIDSAHKGYITSEDCKKTLMEEINIKFD